MFIDGKEKIALVAAQVFRPVQFNAVGSQPDIGIVAGNDDVGAETAGLVSQCAEFDVPVAHDAGGRGQAVQIGIGKIVDDFAGEFFP